MSRQDLSLRSAVTAFLPHACLPVWSRDSAVCGGPKFWLERRYWEHDVLRADQILAWRKKEKERNIVSRVVAQCRLTIFCSRNSITHHCLFRVVHW